MEENQGLKQYTYSILDNDGSNNEEIHKDSENEIDEDESLVYSQGYDKILFETSIDKFWKTFYSNKYTRNALRIKNCVFSKVCFYIFLINQLYVFNF